MLSDDKLEAWNIVLSELKQQLEQSAHCIKIGVGFRFLHRTIRALLETYPAALNPAYACTNPARASS